MREDRIGSARPAGVHLADQRLIARSELVCDGVAGLGKARNDAFAMRQDRVGSNQKPAERAAA